jgi:hypothetical protein
VVTNEVGLDPASGAVGDPDPGGVSGSARNRTTGRRHNRLMNTAWLPRRQQPLTLIDGENLHFFHRHCVTRL